MMKKIYALIIILAIVLIWAVTYVPERPNICSKLNDGEVYQQYVCSWGQVCKCLKAKIRVKHQTTMD